MKPSDRAFEFIRNEEGLVLHAYYDSAHVITIGYGSTMYRNGTKPKIGDTITREQAENLLVWEVTNKTAVLAGYLGHVPVNQNQFDALTSLVYNIGVGGFSRSTLLKTVLKNPSDPYVRICFYMWKYITVGGKKVVSPGLLERRKREWKLYSTPENSRFKMHRVTHELND